VTISRRAAALARALAVSGVALAAAQGPAWTTARPDYAWAFPRDHYAHPAYKTEWWYFTGHLADVRDTSVRFGYQFTIFRVGVLRRAPDLRSDWAAQMLVMGHAAVTDVGARTHRFSEVLYRAMPLLGGFGAPGDSLVAWTRAPAGTDGRWTLRLDGDGWAFAMTDQRRAMAFDLRVRPEKPLAFEGPNGYSTKGPDPTTASQYYSFTRLATEGTLRLDGREIPVRGTSWMDKEFGSNQLAPGQVGWDWFSLHLDDGRDVMLYVLRDSSGAPSWGSGTIVPRGAAPRYLALGDFGVRATARWTSDSTRATYPARWTITVPSEALELDVVPEVADQENRSAIARRLFYWEGAVRLLDAGGTPAGRGYVELVGYGNGMRPAL